MPKFTLIKGGGQSTTPKRIPSLQEPLADTASALNAIARLHKILDTIRDLPERQPVEAVFMIKWRRDLEEAEARIKAEEPQQSGGGER